jgi:uncharacterized protein (AIM24 family)
MGDSRTERDNLFYIMGKKTVGNHEIDYKIYGDGMQFIEVELDPEETVVVEAGSLLLMEDDIQMETIFGDGAHNTAFMGKLFNARRRIVAGESLFMTAFTNEGYTKRHVSSRPYPRKMIPMDLSTIDGRIICKKNAFLAAADGVVFQRKIGTGFSGGEVIQPCELAK